MTESIYRAILTEWLQHGQSRVDWLMNRAYHVLHPLRIRAARDEIERIVGACRGASDREDMLRRMMARCSRWTPDRFIDWKQEPDTLVAREYAGDCEDYAAFGRMVGAACGFHVRVYALWADAEPPERRWYRPYRGHAVAVYYRDTDGAAVLMSSNANVYTLEPLGFASVAEMVAYAARRDTGVAFRFSIPEIVERIPIGVSRRIIAQIMTREARAGRI